MVAAPRNGESEFLGAAPSKPRRDGKCRKAGARALRYIFSCVPFPYPTPVLNTFFGPTEMSPFWLVLGGLSGPTTKRRLVRLSVPSKTKAENSRNDNDMPGYPTENKCIKEFDGNNGLYRFVFVCTGL